MPLVELHGSSMNKMPQETKNLYSEIVGAPTEDNAPMGGAGPV